MPSHPEKYANKSLTAAIGRDDACLKARAREITQYIEIVYNRQPTQECLDYLSCVAFAGQFQVAA